MALPTGCTVASSVANPTRAAASSPRAAIAAQPDSQGYVARPNDRGNLPPSTPPSALGGGTFDNRLLARIGLSRVGHIGRRSKYAVNRWVRSASRGAVLLGGSYYADYVANGAQLISSAKAARPGDIVQLWRPDRPSTYFTGMHTAVVIARPRSSTVIRVVDSDWRADNRVLAHTWNPYRTAAAHGLSVAIWRLGSIAYIPPTPTPSPAPMPTPIPTPAPTPTYSHRVQGTCAEGACGLRVQSGPGSSFSVLNTVFDGQEVQVACQTMGEPVVGMRSTSSVWDRLASGGYVSDYYLDTANAGEFSPPIPVC
jgi:hypothetical protein